MSTRYYELPGIARVGIHATTGTQGRMDIDPDTRNRDVPALGPLTIVGDTVDCRRLLLTWAWHYDQQAAHRSNGVIRVTSTQPDAHPAISEYGDLTTIGALRRGEAP